MSLAFDVIIVGSGPAGVSAAFPLLEEGLKVLLVDGGRNPAGKPPSGSFLENRADDSEQWRWMVGEDFQALRFRDAVSPKLRAPTQSFVFDGFEADNRIAPSDFVAIGSMAAGGLSNAWGCGVAALSREELADYPVDPANLLESYQRVARRMGLSGAGDDDLAGYFGVDLWADPPLPLDRPQSRLFSLYDRKRKSLPPYLRLGRSRVAALSRDRGERLACDLSNACLWGCSRRSLYSATEDLILLRAHQNLTYLPGFIVQELVTEAGSVSIRGHGPQGPQQIDARRIILAAGTLASSRLALQALRHKAAIPLQSCPSAAFLLWLPAFLGETPQPSFGLGQLSFALDLKSGVRAGGNLFNSTGIPLAEFSRYLPVGKRIGIDILSRLMSSCIAGNLFLPGRYTQASLRLGDDESLRIEGGYSEQVRPLMAEAARKLRSFLFRLGAFIPPGGFKIGRPGADIHYAASLPMRAAPGHGQCDGDGELRGLTGVHVADGAALPSLPERPHTLTVMANADRIGRRLAARLRSS